MNRDLDPAALLAYLGVEMERTSARIDRLDAQYLPLLFEVPADDPTRRRLFEEISQQAGRFWALADLANDVRAGRFQRE